jgi:protein-S-isoprenylcysteine O-methyltransferase Ste14
MKLATDIFVILLLFGIFGYLHSFLALNKIKRNIAEKAGPQIAFYRLFYNAASLMLFLVFLEISPKPDIIIYELRPPYDIIIFSLQTLSLLGFVLIFIKWDWKEFLGITQIIRFYNGAYKEEDLDARLELNTGGIYKISRHPIYLFAILFLGLRPYMDLFDLLFFICSVAYFYIGSYFEEKKMIEKYGNEYLEYIKKVPKIFPVKIFNKV